MMIWHKTAGMWVSDCDQYQIIPMTYDRWPDSYHCYKRVSPTRLEFIGYRDTVEAAKAMVENGK